MSTNAAKNMRLPVGETHFFFSLYSQPPLLALPGQPVVSIRVHHPPPGSCPGIYRALCGARHPRSSPSILRKSQGRSPGQNISGSCVCKSGSSWYVSRVHHAVYPRPIPWNTISHCAGFSTLAARRPCCVNFTGGGRR